jgi:hypothetical protein
MLLGHDWPTFWAVPSKARRPFAIPFPQGDSRLLLYADDQPLEPRARLLPEERLEALLLGGDESAVTARHAARADRVVEHA